MPQICEPKNEYFGLLSVPDQVLPVSSGLADENQVLALLHCSFINLNFKFNTHTHRTKPKVPQIPTHRYLNFKFRQEPYLWSGSQSILAYIS